MTTPPAENERYFNSPQEISVTSLKNILEQHMPEPQADQPLIHLDWWDRTTLLQNDTIPYHLLAQAKLELLFENPEKEFREFPPILFYTVRQEIHKKDEEKLKTAIASAVVNFEHTHGFRFRYSGFFTPSSTDSDTRFYNYTHYPRTRQPLIIYDHCLAALSYLEHAMILHGIKPSVSTIRGVWNENRIPRIANKKTYFYRRIRRCKWRSC